MSITLSTKDAREAARLLRILCIHLESAVESSTASGGSVDPMDQPHVDIDRADIASARKLAATINRALK